MAVPQSRRVSPALRTGSGLAAGAATARSSFALLSRLDRPGWRQRNYRGREVSLAAGPALVAGVLAGAAVARPEGGSAVSRALLLAVGPAAMAGGCDDLFGSSQARGLGGHLRALRSGTVTSGIVKVAGIGAGAGLAAYQLGGAGYDVVVASGLVAGAANLGNLLDLRPGRTAKVALLTGVPLVAHPAGWPAAGAVGAVAGLLRLELHERAMLGDCGANALGAALGVATAVRAGPRGRARMLGAIAALTLLSERVSFSSVISRNRVLRWLDRLGRMT